MIVLKRITVPLALTALLLCTACHNIVPSVSENSSDVQYVKNTNIINSNAFVFNNVVQVDWECQKVYKWKDYFYYNYETDENPPVYDFELKLELKDFPDTVFIWRNDGIYSYENGEEYPLAYGTSLWNAFFTDLNSDGFPELCVTVSIGSGIIDDHIIVYDYHNKKNYVLAERFNFDYSLYLENDELYVRKLPYLRGENSEADIGKLAIENDELVMKECK